MFSIFDPRLLLGALLALAICSGLSFFKGVQHGKQVLRAEYASAVAEANREAHKNEQLRQDRVDEAARSAAARERGIRDSAASARNELDGLRGTLDAVQREAEASLATSNNALRVTSELLNACGQRYSDVAEQADRADSEARTLRQAWPR